jgi:hypothetical protein
VKVPNGESGDHPLLQRYLNKYARIKERIIARDQLNFDL